MIQPLRALFCVCSLAAAITLFDSTASAQGRRSGGDDSRRRDEGRDRNDGDRERSDEERVRSFAERFRERFSGGGGFGGDFGGGFGGGGMGDPFGGRGNPWGGGGESRGGNNGSNGGNSDTPMEKPRVTVDLPDGYLAGDLDGDGQIGFYEWRLWQKTGAAQFARWDANGDGFLTPRELTGVSPPSGAASPAAIASSSNASRSNGSTNPFAGGSANRGTTPAGSTRPAAGGGPVSLDDSNPIILKAKNYFTLLDENKDGSIDEKEWDKSNRVKSMFKNAGIDLAQPMPSQQFIETYARLSAT